jgi:phosphomannomutase
MYTIKFGTDGWRAIIAADYTTENLRRVTLGTALWLKKQSNTPSVMVGYDCRFGGKLFAETVAATLAAHGIRVFISPNFVSTPMVSLATAQRQCTAGIVITASHNPPEYSGFKVKGSFGGPAFPADIAEIENLIPDDAGVEPHPFETYLSSASSAANLPAGAATIEYYDMEALYINHLRQSFNLDAILNSGLKIGYDAMYGAGQNVMRRLFPNAELLHCDYNPSFEGQAPEPIERNLKPFRKLILDKGIDFGLATDGDADRIGLFDGTGKFIDSHHIILLLVEWLHKHKGLKGKVVYTFSCTDKIRLLCEMYGLPHQVTKIGFKYISEIIDKEPVLVGGEESGGIAVMGHIPERDGIYIGLLIAEMMAQTKQSLPQLIHTLYQKVGAFSVQRNDLHLTEAKKQDIIANCKSGMYKNFGNYTVEKVEDLDGFKFHLPAGQWVMIRPSGTEPVLRIYAEAGSDDAANAILESTIQTIMNC